MDINEQNQGDYVLVHKSKAKISRARKGLIGFMVVGAIAAISGAGTFASFSASTTNDASFNTGTLILSNAVNTGTACFSSKVSNGGANDADLDVNDTSCDALFASNLVPGATGYSAVVTVRNEGNTAGNLKIFAPNVCQNNAGTTTTNESQKLTFTTVTAGTYTITFEGQTTAALDWDDTAAEVETALEALSNIAAGEVVVTQDGTNLLLTFVNGLGSANQDEVTVGTGSLTGSITPSTVEAGGAALPAGSLVNVADGAANGLCKNAEMQVTQVTSSAGTTPTGTCVIPVAGGACSAWEKLGDIDAFVDAAAHGGTFAAGETRFYKVSIRLPVPTNHPVTAAACTGGFVNGSGCANPWMNGVADLDLRWLLQSA